MPNQAPRHGQLTGPKIRRKRQQQNRGVRYRQDNRYYATYHKEWRRIRQEQLHTEPECRQHMIEHKRFVVATVVDHINGKADMLEDYNKENLQSLCASCHSTKTNLETR